MRFVFCVGSCAVSQYIHYSMVWLMPLIRNGLFVRILLRFAYALPTPFSAIFGFFGALGVGRRGCDSALSAWTWHAAPASPRGACVQVGQSAFPSENVVVWVDVCFFQRGMRLRIVAGACVQVGQSAFPSENVVVWVDVCFFQRGMRLRIVAGACVQVGQSAFPSKNVVVWVDVCFFQRGRGWSRMVAASAVGGSAACWAKACALLSA